MGWRDWFQSQAGVAAQPRTSAAVDVRGDGHMAVVGESFYRPAFDRLTGGGTGDWTVRLVLVREPGNPHDANCVRVQTINGDLLGHLSRENAARFAEGLDAHGGVALTEGLIRRRQPDHDWNVVLRVDYAVLEAL